MEDAIALSTGGQGKYGGQPKEQKISTQVWRIPSEKIKINLLRVRTEENVCNALIRRTNVFTKLFGGLQFYQS